SGGDMHLSADNIIHTNSNQHISNYTTLSSNHDLTIDGYGSLLFDHSGDTTIFADHDLTLRDTNLQENHVGNTRLLAEHDITLVDTDPDRYSTDHDGSVITDHSGDLTISAEHDVNIIGQLVQNTNGGGTVIHADHALTGNVADINV